MLAGNDIRRMFLDYFEKQNHQRLPSSPLIPADDPTLLFVNAGMVQFKNVFTGEQTLAHKRATTSQKCLRVSGKHNDFENVGRTARHHTFFEMLGNFSFGDYFKQDAIRFAWELLTEVYKLPAADLWVTVFREDDEAAEIWLKEIGLDPERVVRMDEKDNYWSMGDTGPNGPCSEILLDQGPDSVPGGAEADIHSDSDRFLELWNLVFMQYNTDQSGKKTPLPKPSIDTGAGLERLTAVLQGKFNNYDSDLFSGIISLTSEIAEVGYGQDAEKDVSLRVVADHIRAMTFLIGDGVLPGNEGRGYVLRRIMRRAARHGVLLGQGDPFLYRVSGAVIDTMKEAYPELIDRRSYIAKVIKNEEERFGRTVANGLKMLNEQIAGLKDGGQNIIGGELAFKLYDTFGFPLDLTADIARDHELTVDEDGFAKSMEKQRSQSAAAWKGTGAKELKPAYKDLGSRGVSCEFVGYDTLKAASEILGLIVDGELVEQAATGAEVELVTATTPFYAEMGGQVGDLGRIYTDDCEIAVRNVASPLPGLIVHRGRVTKGSLKQGQTATLEVDQPIRRATERNHTATHLLHHALRTVLGEDVRQAGSLVTPDRLRFDFTHHQRVDERDLTEIEKLINQNILADRPVTTAFMNQDQAVAEGAIALFGEKYDQTVRVLDVKGVSKELCGGTHVEATGQIGQVRIISESAVAAGVRRIEAVTGLGALAHDQKIEQALKVAAAKLKSAPQEVPERIDKLLKEVKRLEKKLRQAGDKQAAGKATSILDAVKEINGVKFLAAQAEIAGPKELRGFAVKVRDQLKSGVLLLAYPNKGRVMLVCMVTDDLTERFNAGTIIAEVAPLVGGGGGGKADLAEAGGKNPDGLEAAFAKFYELAKG